MKFGKAIAAAVGTAAAVGAAVYAKRRLDESQTTLKKQKSVTAWKNGGKVTHKEIIKNPASEEQQTDILKSRINTATREYEELSQRSNDEEQEITPVNFTFTEAEEGGNTSVSFERVFDHFNKLEEPGSKEECTLPERPEKESVTVAEESTVGSADLYDEDMRQAAAIATALLKPEREKEPVQEILADEAFISAPVEEAVKEFEEISEQAVEAEEQPEAVEETTETVSTLEEEFAQAMAESAPASEPVEEAVKELEEISEQAVEAEEQPEAVEETTKTVSTLEEEFAQAMAESAPASEPVEEAVKELEEISEQAVEAEEQPEAVEETTETVSTLEEEFTQAMAESAPASEPVEEAVKELEEISEQAEDADATDETAAIRTGESVEDALKELSGIIEEPLDNATEEVSTDDLEQFSDMLPKEAVRMPEPVMNTAVSVNGTEELDGKSGELLEESPETDLSRDTEEKPRTLDFFDLPDEAYKIPEPSEEKHDDSVADVEDLFGELLVDDEPEEKKTFTDPAEVFSMFDTDAGQDDFDKYNDEKIEEETEKKKTTDTKKYIAQDIADNIASFAQLLEPLNAIKENKIRSKSGILFDWEMRIQALIGDLPIKTYWRNNFRNYEIWTDEKCMEKAGELLSMLELVGIERDKAKEVVIDKDTLDYYSAQSEHLNNDFHIGETVVVTRPCWKINGRPARKGEIAKKAPFAEFSRKKVSPLETMLRENSCSDGDVNIPVTEDNFCTYDRDIPYVKQAIAEGFCKCAVRRMEDGGALAFFYEVIGEGENPHYSPCTLRFEVNIDKNAKVVGRFRSEKV